MTDPKTNCACGAGHLSVVECFATLRRERDEARESLRHSREIVQAWEPLIDRLEAEAKAHRENFLGACKAIEQYRKRVDAQRDVLEALLAFHDPDSIADQKDNPHLRMDAERAWLRAEEIVEEPFPAAPAPGEATERQDEKPHTVCIGWTTIRRVAQEGAVWFDDVGVGIVAADDLFHSPVFSRAQGAPEGQAVSPEPCKHRGSTRDDARERWVCGVCGWELRDGGKGWAPSP